MKCPRWESSNGYSGLEETGSPTFDMAKSGAVIPSARTDVAGLTWRSGDSIAVSDQSKRHFRHQASVEASKSGTVASISFLGLVIALVCKPTPTFAGCRWVHLVSWASPGNQIDFSHDGVALRNRICPRYQRNIRDVRALRFSAEATVSQAAPAPTTNGPDTPQLL